jgi:hypothetical protein
MGPSGWRLVSSWVVAVAAALAATGAYADVYKCAGDRGSPVYQEMPCPAGKELRNFQTNPPEITVLPGPARAGAASPVAPGNRAKTSEQPEKSSKTANAGKIKGDPAERARARVGMTESEVLGKLGTPDVTSGHPNQVRWTWLPTDGDPEMVTTMTLSNGIVTDLERRTVKK